MKVAMIGLRGLGESLGGVETAVREVSVRLVKKGVDVTCFCRPRYNDLEQLEGVKLRNTPTLYSKHAETAFYAMGAVTKACREDFDILHLHALASSTLSWLPKIISRDKKIVVTIHGLDWQRTKWGPLASGVLKFGEFCGAAFGDATICVSQTLTNYYKTRYPSKFIEYIPNGCDCGADCCQTETPADEAYPAGSYLLYMGRLTPEKGVHRLIQAFRSVATEKKLLIAGPHIHAKKYLKRLVDLAHGDQRIEFIGPIKEQRKESILSNAYAFVLPSELEGLPVSLLEAACRKVPCVVSDIPMNVEIFGPSPRKCGYIFKNRDVIDLEKVLKTCLSEPEKVQKKAETLSKHVIKEYTWEKSAGKTFDVYNKILGS